MLLSISKLTKQGIDTLYPKIQSPWKRDITKGAAFTSEWVNPAFEYLCNIKWVADEKIDGQNVRVVLHQGKLYFGGRSDAANLHKDLITNVGKLFPTIAVEHGDGGWSSDVEPYLVAIEGLPGTSTGTIEDLPPITFYGEGCGAGIQKGGGNYSQNKTFILFDVRIGDYWLTHSQVRHVGWILCLTVASQIGSGTIPQFSTKCREGFKSVFGDFQAEGVVLRPKVPLFDSYGNLLITKIKCRDKYVDE